MTPWKQVSLVFYDSKTGLQRFAMVVRKIQSVKEIETIIDLV